MNNNTRKEEIYENLYYQDHINEVKIPLGIGILILYCIFIVTYIYSPVLKNSIMLIIYAVFVFIILPIIVILGLFIRSALIPIHVKLSREGMTFEKGFGNKNKYYLWVNIAKIEMKEISIGKGRIAKSLKIHLISEKRTLSQYLYPDIADRIQNHYKVAASRLERAIYKEGGTK